MSFINPKPKPWNAPRGGSLALLSATGSGAFVAAPREAQGAWALRAERALESLRALRRS